MTKDQILSEIRRLALVHGRAPGRGVFERETGLRGTDWYPHIWLRWSDAQREAGCTPNQLTPRLDDSFVIGKYIELVRELGRAPVVGELKRKAKCDKSFPSHTVFNRFGGKERLLAAVAAFCKQNSCYEDVLQLCSQGRDSPAIRPRTPAPPDIGFDRGR